MRIRKTGPEDAALHDDEILAAAKVSDALAHPARIRMFRYILKENIDRRIVTNKDLVQATGYAQATVSQHLNKLLVGGLLEMRKQGTSSCYFAQVGHLSTYMGTLKKIDDHSEELGEMPEFLRAELFAQDSGADELHSEDFTEPEDDDYDDKPLFL